MNVSLVLHSFIFICCLLEHFSKTYATPVNGSSRNLDLGTGINPQGNFYLKFNSLLYYVKKRSLVLLKKKNN